MSKDICERCAAEERPDGPPGSGCAFLKETVRAGQWIDLEDLRF